MSKNKEKSERLLLHHGTSLLNAEKIIASGFCASESGQLGAGVYLAREDKAEYEPRWPYPLLTVLQKICQSSARQG
jgi:hypothetical protein